MTEVKKIGHYKLGNNCYELNQSPAVIENRLEILAALSKSLLEEIEALKQSDFEIMGEKINFAEEVQRFEENLIRTALIKTGGRQRKAAKILNLKVSTLNSKIKRFGIL